MEYFRDTFNFFCVDNKDVVFFQVQVSLFATFQFVIFISLLWPVGIVPGTGNPFLLPGTDIRKS
jgi:hypothetical protein